jgi:PEP-CTERM/exosortase A-associated glycosyltransferase
LILGPGASVSIESSGLTWQSETFATFWNGDYSLTFKAIEEKLQSKSAISLDDFEFLTWLTWHTYTNTGLAVTDAMQVGFENQLALGTKSRFSLFRKLSKKLSIGGQAQWYNARTFSGGDLYNWSPSQDVIAIASYGKGEQLLISDNIVESIAAIRFGLPEVWLSGNESVPRPELQSELRNWLAWVRISKDVFLKRHANAEMRYGNRVKDGLLIREGTLEDSLIYTLKNGLDLPPIPDLEGYESKSNKVMYLLHNSLPWDSQGYATRSHAIIKSLNSNGWQAEGITRLGYPYDRHDVPASQEIPADQVIDGVQYHRLGESSSQSLENFNYLSDYAKRSASVVNQTKPKLIHSASFKWNGLVGNHLASQLGIPSVYEIRGLWEVASRSATPGIEFTMSYRLHEKLETQAALQASHVFALTGALRDELVRRGVPAEKITLLPNAVDESRFFPLPRDNELEQKFGYEGKQVIGYVGSLLKYEGLDLLLKAAAELSKIRDDFRVLIVGSGAEHENLLALARDLGLGNIVNFTGRVPHSEVEKYYSLIDIAPFPRLPLPVCEMVSPLKPFEAMAMEKACIVSSCAALIEIVQDGITGRVFEKGSHESLATVLKELLDNPAAAKEFGKSGRDWVLENRTWSKNAKIVQEVYERLLAK